MPFQAKIRSLLSAAQLRLCLQIPTLAASYLSHALRRKRRSEVVKAILVIRMDGLGDCVLTLPLISQLRLCFPSAVIAVVTRTVTADVFRSCPDVDEVLSFNPVPRQDLSHLLQTAY